MATLATCFKDALGNIEPGQDADNARDAHAVVRKHLEEDAWLSQLGVDSVLIGSYARDVSIRRVKDVDVFARLTKADADLNPDTILDHVQDVLTDAFDEDRVERQHRSVKVEFPNYDLAVDVVPARPHGQHWEIPQRTEDGDASCWVETNPLRMTELKEEANATYLLSGSGPGVYVPIVKLVRQVRRTWIDDQPGGFYFEVLTYHAFADLEPAAGTYAEYLTPVLGRIAELLTTAADYGLADPTLPGKIIRTRASSEQLRTAAGRMHEAAELAADALARESPCEAAVRWRQLLGATKHTDEPEHVFPLPSYCNEDGTKKSSRGITTGASTVPAGSDRYA